MKSFALSLLLFVLFAAIACPATYQAYSDPTLFTAALSTQPTILTFDGFAGLWSDYSLGLLFDYSGVTLTNVNGTNPDDMRVENYPGTATIYSWGTGPVLVLPNAAGTFLQVTLPSAVTAIGFYAGGYSCAGTCDKAAGTFVVWIGGDQQAPVPTSNSTLTFLGYISDTPFTTFTIQTSPGSLHALIDNLQFGSAAQLTGGDPPPDTPVAEVSTYLMMGSGLLAMRYVRKMSLI